MASFDLNIELGNAAMLTGDDVAAALRKVADRVENQTTHSVNDDGERQVDEMDGRIFDENGNRVGNWAISE